MLTVAFWNLKQRVKPEIVAALAHESDADILAIAECAIPISQLLNSLNQGQERLYFLDPLPQQRVLTLTRFPDSFVNGISDNKFASVREYTLPLGGKILMVAVHMGSKLWDKTEDQAQECIWLGNNIREAEKKVGHTRTVVLGDFNMNPFESGIVGSEGLHAISDRTIAAKLSRNVKGEPRHFFYNPMWSFFGDHGTTTPGTYFYNTQTRVNYYWNIFDQFIVRPSLIEHLRDNSVQVVTQLDGQSLLNRSKKPDKRLHSDHLPIVLRLLAIERK